MAPLISLSIYFYISIGANINFSNFFRRIYHVTKHFERNNINKTYGSNWAMDTSVVHKLYGKTLDSGV
jgi:hypothetical protein